MRTDPGVLAIFADPAHAARAIRALRARGIRDLHAAMPAPFPEVVAALEKPRSVIDFATLPGAVVGLVFGILLTYLTALDWPLYTGGKPIVAIPQFLVIFFEMTVLVGSIVNLVAVSVKSFFGKGGAFFPMGETFNADRIGVFAAGGADEAERLFREAGATEVRRVS
jgi:Protein of unknown function (DUF3341)